MFVSDDRFDQYNWKALRSALREAEQMHVSEINLCKWNPANSVTYQLLCEVTVNEHSLTDELLSVN